MSAPPSKLPSSPSGPALNLPAELTIYTAAETREAWLAALAQPADGPLVAQAADVAELDGAGLQLLLSLQCALAQQQRALQLQAPSPALRDACRRCGLDTPALGLLEPEARA